MSAKSKYLGVAWKCPKCGKTVVARTQALMQARGRRHQRRNCEGGTRDAKP